MFLGLRSELEALLNPWIMHWACLASAWLSSCISCEHWGSVLSQFINKNCSTLLRCSGCPKVVGFSLCSCKLSPIHCTPLSLLCLWWQNRICPSAVIQWAGMAEITGGVQFCKDGGKQCPALLSAHHRCFPYNFSVVKLPLTVFLMSGVKILE